MEVFPPFPPQVKMSCKNQEYHKYKSLNFDSIHSNSTESEHIGCSGSQNYWSEAFREKSPVLIKGLSDNIKLYIKFLYHEFFSVYSPYPIHEVWFWLYT